MSHSTNSVTVTEAISVVTLDISTWSGGVTMKQGELGVTLPEKAFTRGRKMLVKPEALNPGLTLRRRARDRCLKVGTRFLGGYAVPKGALPDLLSDLSAMQTEFNDFVEDFVQRLTKEVDEWVDQDWCTPEMEDAIRRGVPSANTLRNRFGFDYGVFDIQPSDDEPDNLTRHAEGMGGSVFREVSQAAERIYDDFIEGSRNRDEPRVTQRLIRGSITSLRDKLSGLEFVDKRIPPIVMELDDVLSRMPEKGDITGQNLGEIVSMLVVLSDEEKMQKLGEGLLSRQQFFPLQMVGSNIPGSTPTVETDEDDSEDGDTEPGTETDSDVSVTPPAPKKRNDAGASVYVTF